MKGWSTVIFNTSLQVNLIGKPLQRRDWQTVKMKQLIKISVKQSIVTIQQFIIVFAQRKIVQKIGIKPIKQEVTLQVKLLERSSFNNFYNPKEILSNIPLYNVKINHKLKIKPINLYKQEVTNILYDFYQLYILIIELECWGWVVGWGIGSTPEDLSNILYVYAIPYEQFLLIQIKNIKIMNMNLLKINYSSRTFSKLVILCLVLVLMVRINSMYIHTVLQDPKEYNQQTYYSELQGMQQRFSNDLNNIKDKFRDINKQLANTNISASEKVTILQENLADQRDSLFNVQNYLNVPFALRSCQCVNVTAQEKTNLKNQIQQVSKSISQLDSIVNKDSNGKPYENPNCPDGKCAAVESINSSIKQMKDYIKIMNDTVTSECCKIVNYVYRDNLVSTDSWIYGSTNEEKYRLDLFEQSQKTNLTRCTEYRPFANRLTNQCYGCPSNKPLFDLGTRQCTTSCESKSLLFVKQQHQCDYNRTCEEGKYFNNNTHRCQINLGTASSCPKERPIWSIKDLVCIKCGEIQPFYDTVVKGCRKCTANQVWQVQTQTCIEKDLIVANCSNGTYFSLQTKKCEIFLNKTVKSALNPTNYSIPQQTPTSGTYSQCPPSTPFWSQSDLTCYKCPQNTPSYNSTSNKCQNCSVNTTWSASTKSCVKNHLECPSGQAYNSQLDTCEQKIECKTNQFYNPATGKCDTYGSTGQIGMCPPQSPFWNAKTLYCEKCSTKTPYWNNNAKQCQTCPINTIWDSNNELCKSIIKKCSTGQVYNLKQGKCQAINCTVASPIYNFVTGLCEACPNGTKFNNLTFICESTSPQLRTNTSVCPGSDPYWNPQRLSCDACPLGQSLNEEQKCQPGVSHLQVLALHQQIHQIWQETALHEARKQHTTQVGILHDTQWTKE